MALSSGFAQSLDGIIAQPTHIIGKRINASGEVTTTLESDFTYYENGRPHKFTIPDYALSTTYNYENDYYLERETTLHDSGHPMLTERITYTYEDGKIKTASHTWSHDYGVSEYWIYTYRNDGRLDRKDYKDDMEEDYHRHFLYEYENDGKTKIQNYWTSWASEGMRLRQKIVYQYDDKYRLITRHIENYSVDGELTSSTLDTYSYTAGGKQETQVTQTLVDGEWTNTSILRYVYDNDEQVVEQQDGSWSTESGVWNINRKVVFVTSEDGTTYTVSFYKKSGDEWVWDIFNNQTIFFGSALANQQRTMRFYQEEVHNGLGRINQFEITLIYTEEPVYMGANENSQTKYSVYPNPGIDDLRIVAPTEDVVIRFYSLQGQLMLAHPFDFTTEISTEKWPSGMYIWEIWHGNLKEASGKWIKE